MDGNAAMATGSIDGQGVIESDPGQMDSEEMEASDSGMNDEKTADQ